MNFDVETPQRVLGWPETVGFIGALVSLRWAPGAGFFVRAWNVLCGWSAAVYVTPPLVHWLGLARLHGADLGGAFIVGAFGMNIMAATIEWVRAGGPFALWRSRQ